jgi:protein involved in polysaccharide export with SLBB domain
MVLQRMICEMTTSGTMTSGIVMTPEKLIFERCKPRAESSELAKSHSDATPSIRMLRWIVAALFGLLALPGLGWAQTTLQTPAADDPMCVEQDCSTVPGPPENNDNPMAGGADDQAGTAPRPDKTLPSSNNNEEQNQYAELAQQTKQAFPLKQPFASKAHVIPKPPPNEFQEFVASSVGRKLPIYGHNLFDHVPITLAPVDRIPVTDDYIVEPGDEILIKVWGQIDLKGKLVVDRGGEVFLPKVGTLSVAGLKYQQLPEYFRTAIGRVFRNFNLTVGLGQPRPIQVFVVGQSRRPGTYTVCSHCTIVNALLASGGPSSNGSMRRIQLKRNNSVVAEFDFYDLLLKGDKSKDARLLPGDVIYIPPTGPSIAIAGSVNMPAIYELQKGTTLGSAVEIAGGLTTTADGQNAVVERIESHNARWVEEFPLDGPGLERALNDGELVRISQSKRP